MFNKLKVMIFGGMPDENRRRLARSGKVPALDSHIIKQQLVIKITEPMVQDLWDWLVLMGWREIDMKSNRRKVRRLGNDTFAKIAQADYSVREEAYRELLK